MRTCKDCGLVGEAPGHFYESVVSYCKECWKARQRRRRQEDPAVREYEARRATDPHRRASLAQSTRRWREENPDKVSAHRAVAYAKRTGRLVNPGRCEGCKKKTNNLHCHHKDYERPLDVEWYCPRCHSIEIRKAY